MVTPLVALAMGSDSDWECMRQAAIVLKDFGIEYEAKVVSAHRTPHELPKFCEQVKDKGVRVIIAGAGGAAHLPGMLASYTMLPVIGIPVKSSNLSGVDSLLSIVQMPKGVPVATMAINNAANGALFALRMLAFDDEDLMTKLVEFSQKQAKESMEKTKNLKL